MRIKQIANKTWNTIISKKPTYTQSTKKKTVSQLVTEETVQRSNIRHVKHMENIKPSSAGCTPTTSTCSQIPTRLESPAAGSGEVKSTHLESVSTRINMFRMGCSAGPELKAVIETEQKVVSLKCTCFTAKIYFLYNIKSFLWIIFTP